MGRKAERARALWCVVAFAWLGCDSPAARTDTGVSPAASQSAEVRGPSLVDVVPTQRSVAVLSTDPLVAAIEKTATYLSSVRLRGDQAVLIHHGAALLGPAYEPWAAGLIAEPSVVEDARVDPLGRDDLQGLEGALWKHRVTQHAPWTYIERPSSPAAERGAVATAMTSEEVARVFETMRGALVCSRTSRARGDAWRDGLLAPASGYVLTHQLFAASAARDRGCLSAEEASRIREALATRLWAEQRAFGTTIDDLSVERVAVLAYVGLVRWVDDAFFDALLAAQKDDGSWGNVSVAVHEKVSAPAAHTAALAFYALAARWSERQPRGPGPQVPR